MGAWGGAVRGRFAAWVQAILPVVDSVVVGSMNMSMGHVGGHSTSLGGTSMSVSPGATNILPEWLAIAWTLVFLALIVVQVRHLLDSTGQRRLWHAALVLLAFGMAFMFAPPSIDHFNIPSGFWQLAFANGALGILAWMLAQALAPRAINVLWLLTAVDLAALAYMWSPGGLQGPITWLLVVYFAAQSLLWAGGRMCRIDHKALLAGSVSLTPDGALVGTAAESLIGSSDLRLPMCVLTLGIAYMFAAMQLLM